MKIKDRLRKQVDLVLSFLNELESEESYRGVERLTQLVLQSLLDLGLMFISALGGEPPRTYRDVGRRLKDLNLISGEEAVFLEEAAGMRNLLVHAYARIDPNIVLKAARDEIPPKTLRILRSLKAMIEKLDIDPSLNEDLGKIFEGKVRVAFLYGSRLKGYRLRGDYDIAVYFGRPYSLGELAELSLKISEVLKEPLESIDIVPLDNASPGLVIDAIFGEPLYYRSEEELFETRYKLLIEALDTKWLEDIHFSYLREKYL